MHIINDFFLLTWEEDAKQIFSSFGDIKTFLTSTLDSNQETFCDYASILLIVTPLNIDNFSTISEAREAMEFLVGLEEWDKQSVQYIQKELLFFLSSNGNIELNQEIEQRLDILRKENIIGYETSRRLISLLALIESKEEKIKPIHVIKAESGSNFFESAINSLCTAVDNLKNAVEDESLNERLSIIPQKIRNEKFSIGITGVMNAGKSTLLNALLGKEILGTSVVPETANLSIIKHAKTPSAKVNFWTTKEWQNIEKSALTLESMKPFVQETKKYFKDNLESFITEDGFSAEINIDELPSYTSAEHSDKKCNLVKSVELYTDLKFVQNGVEIVDTPGLDDPVIQREEITKGYLFECDLMCHLMNVNQSATQKDIEFIVDTLLYQSIARLLIVITRIDTVSTKELDEVIEYTKSSIKTKLQSLNKEAQFNSIIDKIDFIPIAGKMALMHRIGEGEEATRLGYPIEKTGISNIENYLSDVLFGDNSQKAQLVIESNTKELVGIANISKNTLQIEKDLLGKSASEIENEYNKYQEDIVEIKTKITKLNQDIDQAKDELISYFSTLKNISKNKMISLKTVVKRRVIDDVSYELRKNKTKPQESRIASIIETGIKDGFIDMLRDYRYQFQKRMQDSFEKIQRDFEGFIDSNNNTEDAKEFFQKHFSDLNLVNSNLILIEQVNAAIKSASKKDIEGIDKKCEAFFIQAFDELYSKFDDKAQKINIDLVNQFELTCKKPLKEIEFEMQTKEENINKAKQRVQDKSFDTSKRLSIIEQKVMLIDKVKDDLTYLGKTHE
ncbi:dynamin family protein [Sulfurimonas sp.]|uniref:dynamin family protein n=1 Tax=Sulfurimonas sp. TaxID=2022749 RepID=UPI0025D30AE3|nr:dynamin family protein [Sulfurimonas sp.]